jgi:hypothetical protein
MDNIRTNLCIIIEILKISNNKFLEINLITKHLYNKQ